MLKIRAIILAVVLLLSGCTNSTPSPTETAAPPPETTVTTPPPETTEPTQPPETQPPDIIYTFDEYEFSLTFPGHWTDRFTLTQSDSVVEVLTDGSHAFSYAAHSSKEGASEFHSEMLSQGFEYFCESDSFLYYWKVSQDIPEDLTSGLPTYAIPFDRPCENAATQIFNLTSQKSPNIATKPTTTIFFQTWLYMEDLTYTNPRLGITLHIPESWKGNYIIAPDADRVAVYLKEDLEAGRRHFDAPLFMIIAPPKDQPSRWDSTIENMPGVTYLDSSETFEYYMITYPDVFTEDKRVYWEPYSHMVEDLESQITETIFEMS